MLLVDQITDSTQGNAHIHTFKPEHRARAAKHTVPKCEECLRIKVLPTQIFDKETTENKFKIIWTRIISHSFKCTEKGLKKIQLEDKMRRDMNCNFTAWLRQFWNSVNDLSCTLEQVSLLNYSKVLAAIYAGVILRCSYCKNMNVSCGESAGQLCVLFLWCFYSYHHKQVFNVTSVKYHLIVTEAQDMFPF